MSTVERSAPVRVGTSRRVPLYVQILVAMALGLVLGPLLGTGAAPFGDLGRLVIALIKAIAAPLVFLVIVSAVLTTEIRARAALRLLGWAGLNVAIALAIGLALSNLLQPGTHLSALAPADPAKAAAYEGKDVDVVGFVTGVVPTSVVSPFAENNLLAVVLLALLTGFGLRAVQQDPTADAAESVGVVQRGMDVLLRMTEVILRWVIALIPLAVFGVVTKAVGENGYAPLRGLAVYVGVGVLGLALHVAITYNAWLLLFVRRPLREFWGAAREPVTYALGSNSSLATLPVTLRALDGLGVRRSSSALGACAGTNLNNDGIVLYEGMAVLFVAQAAGIDLSFSEQALVAVVAVVAAMGVAGVPEAGFISLALVLNTVGLPIELLPLLLTVDWIIARARSVTNVLSDMVLSLLLDRHADRAAGPSRALADRPPTGRARPSRR